MMPGPLQVDRASVFNQKSGAAGMGIVIALRVAFACSGCLPGYSPDRKNKHRDK